MVPLKCSVLILVFTLAGAGVIAGPRFQCSLKPISGNAWIPREVSFHFSDDFKTAEIKDLAFGVPVTARIERHSETSFALNWALPKLAVAANAGLPGPRFRAVLNTSNLKMSIQAVRKDKDGVLPRGSGHCQVDQSLSLLAQSEG
ncbi:hypothetical protein N6L27_00165 [Leisingera sp. SS27]|uniref:hypothetical protein n=1 Tax=Leisingera sp. SS27 TaxID=2979462 RepID=UPI0023312115|nr:hypothetical protein [Leisingera sp. SS27]MDC0656407.1 hypothetical protein [Leisingera sp. SS27]